MILFTNKNANVYELKYIPEKSPGWYNVLKGFMDSGDITKSDIWICRMAIFVIPSLLFSFISANVLLIWVIVMLCIGLFIVFDNMIERDGFYKINMFTFNILMNVKLNLITNHFVYSIARKQGYRDIIIHGYYFQRIDGEVHIFTDSFDIFLDDSEYNIENKIKDFKNKFKEDVTQRVQLITSNINKRYSEEIQEQFKIESIRKMVNRS